MTRFGAGLASVASPCVLPVVPLLVSGTADALRPRAAKRHETPLSAARDGGIDESGLSLAERKANAKRVADASADAYRRIGEALKAGENGN